MCPSCHSNDVSRSRKRKLKDSFMRWMGKVAYRCRDCQKRFYVNIDVDRRLRRAQEWKRRSDEVATTARAQTAPSEGDFEKHEDPDA
jgi:transposase-like protein